MVGHFLQNNRRNRSSLSQPANTTADLNETPNNISSASTSTSSSNSSTDYSTIPLNGHLHSTHYPQATIAPETAMNMNGSNNFGYNVNGSGGNNNNPNNTVNTNGNHKHQQKAMKINPLHSGSSSAQYTPPQNLTAEAVAALPPPGASR